MTQGGHGYHGEQNAPSMSPIVAISPVTPPSPELSLRIPKNKSTGNLLLPQAEQHADKTRTRFSFDAGSAQEMSNLKRAARMDRDHGMGTSGLRRIRRQGPSLQTPTLVLDSQDFIPRALVHANTLPISRSTSRSASAGFLMSGPSSPVVEDLHRFPSESLHSFSFARQSEDVLHTRQNILRRSVDFMRDRSTWANNPALADAQARVSGDAEIQGMMDLLRKANILPIDTNDQRSGAAGIGPLTGPAGVDGRNIFDKSFRDELESGEEIDFRATSRNPPRERSSSWQPDSGSGELEGEAEVGAEASDPARKPSVPRRLGLKRTYTDLSTLSLQEKLIEALAQPYSSEESGLPPKADGFYTILGSTAGTSSVHSHSSKWTPAAQAVFRTDANAPWTILAANDLACLIFGVTRAEVRSLSILGIIQEDRRQWLEDKLRKPEPRDEEEEQQKSSDAAIKSANLLITSKSGITARLLSKAPSRVNRPSQRAQTDNGSGGYYQENTKNHPPTKSRGVLLCGDVVPIQKRNGTLGSASFWVMEKRGGLIWVVEEITEDVALLEVDLESKVISSQGDVEHIWGQKTLEGSLIRILLPRFPVEQIILQSDDVEQKPLLGYYTARTSTGISIPTTVSKSPGKQELRISSLPHIAGVMVLEPGTLNISSANSAFSSALFGYDKPEGLSICNLIPCFKDLLAVLTDEEDVELVDGLVIPEQSFRRARALLPLREGKLNAASIFMRPLGLPAKHRDGSDITVDLQMRVVRSETIFPIPDDAIIEEKDESQAASSIAVAELVYAVWITYSRQLHSAAAGGTSESIMVPIERPFTPPTQPDPPAVLPSPPVASSSNESGKSAASSEQSLLMRQLSDGSPTSIDEPLEHPPPHTPYIPHPKKTINDFIILEEMGSGAYGQVKLARYRQHQSRKMVIKYVTKKRILVDTWTRDRRLGTVPLEIHVMDYLRRDGLRHPNIVEMIDFFEDDVNYYIEMLPHGIPGMDLFDYIELRANMEEAECRNIFKQVVDAVHHLHTKAFVVHRDIKDENVVLDGEGRIKLIDFGSAAYIKNGPFDVFVGTIDYAAPEVLQGKAYGGKEQDVWAMGILLYTIVYKENPFYNIDEILDHPLRVPFLPFSEDCIDLIRQMLDRDVEERITIEEIAEHPWLIQE